MVFRQKVLRLLLGLSLGLGFFGCVGLPRRRPLTDAPDAQAQRSPSRELAPRLDVPADPAPVTAPRDVVRATATVPADTTPPTPSPVPRAPVPPAQPAPEPPPQASPPSIELPPSAPRAPAGVTGPSTSLALLRQLYQASVRQYAGMNAYIVRLTRREFVKGKYQPEEVVLFKFRKEPWSLYFKWVGPVGKGRELVYVKGRYENKIHTRVAAGDSILIGAGTHLALAPDSLLVRSSSRHPITEAGIGPLLDYLGATLDALEKGDTRKGTLAYLGPQKRPEFAAPLDGIEWTFPAGIDPSLPHGGRRWCFCDRDTHLPVLILTHDENGQEVEYYRYDRFQYPVPLDEDDFNPDKLWARPGRAAPR